MALMLRYIAKSRSCRGPPGYPRLADVVGVTGYFSTTAMMANVVGAEPPTDAVS
jgi:hypothetical protein